MVQTWSLGVVAALEPDTDGGEGTEAHDQHDQHDYPLVVGAPPAGCDVSIDRREPHARRQTYHPFVCSVVETEAELEDEAEAVLGLGDEAAEVVVVLAPVSVPPELQ